LSIEEEREKNQIGEGVIRETSKLKNKYDGLVYEKAYMNSQKNYLLNLNDYNKLTEVNKMPEDINFQEKIISEHQINSHSNKIEMTSFQDLPEFPSSGGCSNPGGCACAQKAASKYN
jgi:hypothetical protein